MNDRRVVNVLGQVQPSEAGSILRDWLRGEVRGLIADLMAEEVTALCGVPYHPSAQSECRRAGSSPMRVRIDGRSAAIRRPRVRRQCGDGSSGEVALSTAAAARHADDLRESILRAFAAGVSSRDQRTLNGAESASRSTVSRIWVVEGRRRIERLRERDLAQVQFFALVLDGIALSDDLTAIVALGITLGGSKVRFGSVLYFHFTRFDINWVHGKNAPRNLGATSVRYNNPAPLFAPESSPAQPGT